MMIEQGKSRAWHSILSIYAHDIIPISTISKGELSLEPDESAPIADQEKYLTDGSMIFL